MSVLEFAKKRLIEEDERDRNGYDSNVRYWAAYIDGVQAHMREQEKQKCATPDVTIKPDGVHELDPCVYEEIEEHTGCTVRVLKCRKCGHVEIEWEEEP